MAKEYKTLTFEDSLQGRQEMAQEIDLLANQGWEIKSKEVAQQGWGFDKTCCLGCLFLPLALLGKKPNVIQVIMEREKQPKKTEASANR
jgi:hypothetical protein